MVINESCFSDYVDVCCVFAPVPAIMARVVCLKKVTHKIQYVTDLQLHRHISRQNQTLCAAFMTYQIATQLEINGIIKNENTSK